MNSKAKQAAKRLGYCCLFAYIKTNAKEKVAVLSLELSITERMVKVWKSRLRNGELSCTCSNGCFIQLQKSLEHPDTHP
jgi:hypothetical protein